MFLGLAVFLVIGTILAFLALRAIHDNGISEAFSEGETSFRIDEKATASECIARSALSFIEYENKDLAGDDFFGFNLFVEEDSWMVLTYNGCAVATLTKEERETTAIINGETVKGSLPAYRTNTFPPELREGMAGRQYLQAQRRHR